MILSQSFRERIFLTDGATSEEVDLSKVFNLKKTHPPSWDNSFLYTKHLSSRNLTIYRQDVVARRDKSAAAECHVEEGGRLSFTAVAVRLDNI